MSEDLLTVVYLPEDECDTVEFFIQKRFACEELALYYFASFLCKQYRDLKCNPGDPQQHPWIWNEDLSVNVEKILEEIESNKHPAEEFIETFISAHGLPLHWNISRVDGCIYDDKEDIDEHIDRVTSYKQLEM